MAYKGIVDDVKKCAAMGKPSRTPCFPIHVMYDYYRFGYSHKQLREDPEAMAAIAKSGIDTFDYDWYMHHPDDLIEYEDFGMGIKFEEDLPPAVKEYLDPREDLFEGIKIEEERKSHGRLAKHLEGMSNIKAEFGDTICLTGRIAAPFTAVSLIIGIENTMYLMIENPRQLREYMDFLLEYNDMIAQFQLAAGADAIWVGDCTATSHFISPGQFEEFALEHAAEAIERVKKGGGICFYHGGELSVPHFKVMSDLPFDAINIGYGVDIKDVKDAIGSKVCIMGNLDTINKLQPVTPEEVTSEVQYIVETGKAGGGYMFCTGEGITHNTPEENIKAMVQAVRKYGE